MENAHNSECTFSPLRNHLTSSVWLWLFITPSLPAENWPQYRGPFGNGSSPEQIRTDWIETPPVVLWRQPIGTGFSSITSSQSQLFTQEKRMVNGQAREYCISLDRSTGNLLWAIDVDIATYDDLAGYDDRIDGPRTTPSVQGNFVYLTTSQFKVYCLNRETGQTVWSRNLVQELGSQMIPWQNCASPLIVDNLLFLNANSPEQSLMALHTSDGSIAWRGENAQLTHATPTWTVLHDIPQVIFLTRSGFISMQPQSGTPLWRAPFSPSSTSTAATPLVIHPFLHASAAYSAGTWVFEIHKDGDTFSATELYRQRGNTYQLHWSSPVTHDGYVYAIPSPTSSQGRLVCMDTQSGTIQWQQIQVGSQGIGFGNLIKTSSGLLVQAEGGELVLVQFNPLQYEELARFKLLDFFCWNHPILSDGILYSRNSSAQGSEIVALDLSLPNLAPSPISLSAEITPEGIQLRLTPTQVPNTPPTTNPWEILTSTDPSLPTDQWDLLSQPATWNETSWIIPLPPSSTSNISNQYFLGRWNPTP